jgi:crotonobetainyl-CoA:carnitine CoA-transferase CaiB-like acyl-CoA transferase
MTKRPYEGLSVVEAVSGEPGSALRLAGAMAGRILADLGARVVQLAPGGDEPSRGQSSTGSARGHMLDRFLSVGKSALSGDLGDGAFVARAMRGADIAIVDRPVHRTVATSQLPANVALLSLFGGRLADTGIPASEFTVSALGGLLNMVGDPERQPLKLGGHQEAYALGLAAFCGLAALLADGHGRRDGPMTVSANLLDTVIWLNWKTVPLEADAPIPPGRSGAAAEWQVLRCADGFVALVYQEPDWLRLCEMVGDERLKAPRFAARQGRLDHAVELATIIESVMLTRTRQQIHEQALQHRLPLGPVWNPGEVIDDPHNVERALFEELPLLAKDRQAVRAPRLPVLWNGVAFSSSARRAAAKAAVGLP